MLSEYLRQGNDAGAPSQSGLHLWSAAGTGGQRAVELPETHGRKPAVAVRDRRERGVETGAKPKPAGDMTKLADLRARR